MQHQVDPHMIQLLWQGLQAIHNNTPIDEQYESYPDSLQPLFQAQQDIGWDQLYYGCISTQWAQHLTRSSQYKINGDVFYSQVIGIIWSYIFDCWKQWNTHLHSPDLVPPDFPVLAEQVCLIIDTANQDPALTYLAPNQTAEQILQQPIPRIHDWAQCSTQHMQNYISAAHKCTVLQTHDIRNFFKPKQKNDLQPP